MTHIKSGLFFCLLLSTALVCRAQDSSTSLTPHAGDNKSASQNGAGAASGGNAQIRPGKITPWFELQAATLFIRYRFVSNSAGLTTANQSQYKEVFKARFKFDREGRYSINAGVFTGRNFIATWNNTGLGTGDGQTNLALKQLFLSARPIDGVEFQYGGLYLQRGESTEITSYDEDGYIMGERVAVKRPDKFFFDEIDVTYAYLGDVNLPNIDKRYHRLKQSNYHQFLVDKKIGQRAAVSFDYTFEAGRETLREALKLNIPKSRALDSIRFENYQRLTGGSAYGFALHGEKAVGRRLTINGGYAQIDSRYGGLNADRFGSGKRFFILSSLQLSPEFTLSTYATRAVANSTPVNQRVRLDVVLSYNLLRTLQRTGIF